MYAYGAYAKDIVLARPDRRSREGRLLRQMREALLKSMGGADNVTVFQRVLIERAAQMQLRCATLDQKLNNGSWSEYDSKAYIAFSNSLTRTIAKLNAMQPAVKSTKATRPMDAVAEYGNLLDAESA